MIALHPVTEVERAHASLANCESHIRLSYQRARRAEDTLRRALREVAQAEDALLQATIHLDRVPPALHRASRR